MRNFIRFNIQNVKGSRKPASLIQKGDSSVSPPRGNQNTSNPYPRRQTNINSKVKKLEAQLQRLQNDQNQSLIIQQLSQIKQDIRMIKSHIYQVSHGHRSHSRHSRGTRGQYSPQNNKMRTNSSNHDEDQNIINIVPQTNNPHIGNTRLKSHSQNQEFSQKVNFLSNHQYGNYGSTHNHQQRKKILKIEEIINQKNKRTANANRSAIQLKVLAPMVKQYKLEEPQVGTIFYGYAKRNSQPVTIKYSQESQSHIIEVYDRMWKNIAKAKWPCINRMYDYKSDDVNIVVLEKNKSNILGLPYENVVIDIIKIIEFVHECGYLYRNVQPQHFMLNEEDQLVAIDFKRAKRYVDIKGHPMQIIQSTFTGSPFASNNQIRGLPEGRKDDLESLGYLALLLFQMEIPWAGMNRQQTIRVRSSLTLQELFSHNPKWIQYMAVVMKTPRNERPDYKRLVQIISG